MMIPSDGCSQLVAGNYDVIVNEEPSLKTVMTDFLERFEQHELDLQHSIGTPRKCGYSTEFKLLKEFSRSLKEDKANLEAGEQEHNLRKNRYKDIIPFSHTRVILSSGDNQLPGADYINANYVRGPSGSPKAYIACQGPLPCTLNDFWRMIWECNVSVIVMACNEHESGESKCELYWPQQVARSQCYGNIQITLDKVRQINSDFLIRKFSVKLMQTIITKQDSQQQQQHQQQQQVVINCSDNLIQNINNNNNKNIDNLELKHQAQQNYATTFDHWRDTTTSIKRKVLFERTICQFHYTTWPDHGVPSSVEPILELVRLIRDVQPDEDKPILVHCSAGCGRTGTICCIDYVWGLLRRGKLDANFDLCRIISEMRQQRMSMVQTLEQYILCHKAVASLFIKQLKLLDNHHIYSQHIAHLNKKQEEEEAGDIDDLNKIIFEEHDLGPVFI